MASKGASGSGGRKGSLGLSKEENWNNNNLNSPVKVLTRQEQKLKKVEDLRKSGVHEKELKLSYDVPLEKRNQGPEIDPLNTDGAGLITVWSAFRRNYYYLLIFGGGTPQAEGEMNGICKFIDESLKPRISKIRAQIFAIGRRERINAQAVAPPPFFYDEPLEDVKLPIPLPRGAK